MYAQETVEQKRIPSVSVYPNPDAVLKLIQIQNRNNLTKTTSDAIKKENKESNPECIQSGNSLISGEELLILLLVLCNNSIGNDIILLLTALMFL